MQIKTTVSFLIVIRITIIKMSINNKCWRGCGEKGILLHWWECWWECKLVQPLWRIALRFLKKLNPELRYDPANPLLSIHPEKNIIWKATCTPMFTAAIFITAKTQKQPKCPSAEEWIKKMWYIYNRILLNYKKEWSNVICSNVDGSRDFHIKWNKSDWESQISYYITHMQNLIFKNDINELI